MLKIEFEANFEQINFSSPLFESLKENHFFTQFQNPKMVFNKHKNLKKELNTKRRRNFSQLIKPIKKANILPKKNFSIFEKHLQKNILNHKPNPIINGKNKGSMSISKNDINHLNKYKKVVLKNKNRQNLTEFMFRFSFAVNQSYNNELKDFENIYKDFSLDSQISYFHTLEYLKSTFSIKLKKRYQNQSNQ
jgi:hypothetical protein